jgi:Fungalysin metallopeptidase (M36)/FG-GAP-like repeat
MGEMWSLALWEVRDQLIDRHGAAEGNRRALQYVTDGMKLNPLNPTMLNARDSIIAAATISDPGDAVRVWRGFAIRGMGFSASITNIGTGNNNTVVTEAFNMPPKFRRPARADFDGDGRSDVSVFRPSDGVWYLNQSFSGFAAHAWGISTDTPVPDDFDGDGKSDLAVYRPNFDGAVADYFVFQSATSTVRYVWWGTTGDIAITEDFDGDNKADPAIYRPSTGVFWALRSTNGTALAVTRMAGSVVGAPIAGDFDGDGRGDLGLLNNGAWNIVHAADNYATISTVAWGTSGDRAVHGDYDGDGRDDIAVFRGSENTWFILNSAGGVRYVYFGASTDLPVPADYDGDGRTDVAVYRNGVWYIDRSTSGFQVVTFGAATDKPLPASFIP